MIWIIQINPRPPFLRKVLRTALECHKAHGEEFQFPGRVVAAIEAEEVSVESQTVNGIPIDQWWPGIPEPQVVQYDSGSYFVTVLNPQS